MFYLSEDVFMFLNSTSPTLDVSFHLKHAESLCVVFASTNNLRCFDCGDLGQMRQAYPHKDKGWENVPGGENGGEMKIGQGRRPALVILRPERSWGVSQTRVLVMVQVRPVSGSVIWIGRRATRVQQ